MADFALNFAQMAAQIGVMGNPAMGLNPIGLLQDVAGTALKGVDGALQGADGIVKGIEDLLGLGPKPQPPQAPQQPQHHHHHHRHHHHHHQHQPTSPIQQEIQKLEAEIKHLGDDMRHLTGGAGGQNPFGPGFGQPGQYPIDPGFGNIFPGGGSPFGQNPFGQGGMNPFGQDFGSQMGQPNGFPYGCGFGDPAQQSPWAVTNTGNGKDHIDLGNYTLDLNEQNMQWTLTNKKTGDKTDISGDPHVNENGNKWDFKKDLSFQLDDGTRITVHTIPYGNGQTISSELDITKGSHGMKVTGLGGNLDGALTVSDGLNGYALDAANNGTPEIYEAAGNWQLFDGTNINQQIATQDNL
jgi:hypothetical protein